MPQFKDLLIFLGTNFWLFMYVVSFRNMEYIGMFINWIRIYIISFRNTRCNGIFRQSDQDICYKFQEY